MLLSVFYPWLQNKYLWMIVRYSVITSLCSLIFIYFIYIGTGKYILLPALKGGAIFLKVCTFFWMRLPKTNMSHEQAIFMYVCLPVPSSSLENPFATLHQIWWKNSSPRMQSSCRLCGNSKIKHGCLWWREGYSVNWTPDDSHGRNVDV